MNTDQVALYLISEELKSRKLFQVLNEIGLNESYFQPQLDELILQSIGLDGESDEIFEAYTAIMEKRSGKINANRKMTHRQAMKAYLELKNLKRITQQL